MNLKNTLLMAAFGLIMSAFTVQSMPGPESQPAYSIVDLGTLGGNTFASAINSQGEVVGYSNLSNGNFRAFLYEKGVMHDIGFLGTNKNDQSYAYAINASGVVVGASEIDPTGTTHAFLFNGHMHDLGTLGGTISSAAGINNLGQVVGTSTTKNNVYHAFVYNADKMTDLGTIVGTTGSQVLPFSSASGINQIGEIVGTSTYNTPPLDGQLYHPFLYANGHMYDLGTNPGFGSDDGGAVAINDHGQVVGFAQDLGGDIVFGFLYSAGVVTKINNIIPVNPRTPDGVEVNAVNNSGAVVGDDPNEPPMTEYGTGFIYRGGVTLNANTLLPPNSGWVIGNCTGINDGGQICGYGLHNGVERSFVLTPIGSPLLP